MWWHEHVSKAGLFVLPVAYKIETYCHKFLNQVVFVLEAVFIEEMLVSVEQTKLPLCFESHVKLYIFSAPPPPHRPAHVFHVATNPQISSLNTVVV
jgi:hypothetical protein